MDNWSPTLTLDDIGTATKTLIQDEAKKIELNLTVQVNNANQSSSTSHAQSLALASQWQQSLQKTINHTYKDLTRYATKHTRALTLTSVLVFYGCISLLLTKAYFLLHSSHTWANWHRSRSLKTLLEEPHEQITHELLKEIYQRYMNKRHPTDAILSLVHFMSDIAMEQKRLLFYEKLCYCLTRYPLSKLFPLAVKISPEIKTQQERLAYVTQLFTSWTVQQKLSLTDPLMQHETRYRSIRPHNQTAIYEWLQRLAETHQRNLRSKKVAQYAALLHINPLTTSSLNNIQYEEELKAINDLFTQQLALH